MQTSTDILNELQAISPTVAAIEKRNLFTVPDGYFESLSNAVLIQVQNEGTLINSIAQPALEVPQGYFDSLASNILNKIKAQEEEITLSPLLQSIQQQNVFTVPQGYFQSLAGDILNKATAEVDAATEIRELSPMLYSIQNENVFTVPQGYFESLATVLLRKVEPQQAKVVSMKKRTTGNVLKYAIAAAFTGVMALGVYKFTNSKSSVALPGYVAEGKKITNVDAELAKVTDDDIIKYLQTNGDNIDAQTVASNLVNTEELPTQDDYLTDDKALDKYLDNVDLNDLKN